MGEVLIEVTSEGTHPTAAAMRLAPAVQDMLQAANSIRSAKMATDGVPIVRITCGPWMAAFISKNVRRLVGGPVDTEIEVSSSTAFADLPRRQADIAVRNQRPTDSHLTLKRLPDYACAVYGDSRLVAGNASAFDSRRFAQFDWVALFEELDHFPTARWLADRLRKRPVARFSTSINLLDAVKSSSVLAVLPCFAGELETGISRVSKPFIPDYGGHWMVLGADTRRRPHVRRAASRIESLLGSSEEVLAPSTRCRP